MNFIKIRHTYRTKHSFKLNCSNSIMLNYIDRDRFSSDEVHLMAYSPALDIN